jgi:ferrochelatase
MTPPTDHTAVLLLAYGGPDSLDDIPAYLLDIRGGRETPQPLIDEITDRYAQIGGSSPLKAIAQSAAQKLSERINLPVAVGMRHWHPYVKDVVAQMAADGVEHLIAICMAPHYSFMSIGAYKKVLDEAVEAIDADLAVTFVESWGTHVAFIRGLAANVQTALDRFEAPDNALVVFSAHSLPALILERGDPYDDQLRETARLVADRLGLPDDRWTFCYQSAAKTGTPWLGPQIEDYIVELAARGHDQLVAAPVGFIADHVEVLYDLDIELQAVAAELGMRVERPPMLNDSDALVEALAEIVQGQLELTT